MEKSKEKIQITKELKIKMLTALKRGYAYAEDFEELHPKQVVIFKLPDNGRDDERE